MSVEQHGLEEIEVVQEAGPRRERLVCTCGWTITVSAQNPETVDRRLGDAHAEHAATERARARPVPDDLQRWFAGETVLAERFGLPRIEVRRRVIEVEAVLGEDREEPRVVRFTPIREYRTAAGSAEAMARLERAGATGLEQIGVLVWLDATELGRLDDESTPPAVAG